MDIHSSRWNSQVRLDTDGKVLFPYVNPDYKVRIDWDLLLAAARAYAE